MRERKTLLKGQLKSEWYESTAPNGCYSQKERSIHTVEIFEADWYGKGPKKYAQGYYQIENGNGNLGPRTGGWQDGYIPAVEKWEQRLKENA